MEFILALHLEPCSLFESVHWSKIGFSWIPRNLSFRYILFNEKRLQTMLWHQNARVNSHQRWKQTRFRVCFHLWCELTSTMNVMERHVSWNSWLESSIVGCSCHIGKRSKWNTLIWAYFLTVTSYIMVLESTYSTMENVFRSFNTKRFTDCKTWINY